MQKILSFHIFKYLLPEGAHRQTGLIAGKLTPSTNSEKRGNGRIAIENSTSIYQHLRDYSLEGLTEFRRVVCLKCSVTFTHICHHLPFTFTGEHYVQNRILNYLSLYCANTEPAEGKGYTN